MRRMIARRHIEAYRRAATGAPFSFPDWVSLEDHRRLEYLEQRLQQTEERRDTFNQRLEKRSIVSIRRVD
jgi:hypothetical protein